VTVTLLDARDPDVGDVVLVRCRGHEYLHLMKARQGDRFLIGNNRGGLNGWVGRRAIFGVATRIVPPQKVAGRIRECTFGVPRE
jgi:hypothetical protein